MATDESDFVEFVLGGSNRPFSAKPYYNQQGDTLFFFTRDVQSYAKRLNPIITLILETANDSLVGVKIKGIQRILRSMMRLGVNEISEQGIRFRIIKELALVSPPDDPAMEEYESDLGEYDDVIVDRRELELTGG